MSDRSRFIFLTTMGMTLGMVIAIAICVIIGFVETGEIHFAAQSFIDHIGDPTKALIIEILLCGVMGAIDWGGTIVYYLESWSILRATVTHYIVVMAVYYPIAFYLRWLTPDDIATNLIFFVCLTIAYIMIWMINYLKSKAAVAEINRDLQELKEMDMK